jgi:hypothetical protein
MISDLTRKLQQPGREHNPAHDRGRQLGRLGCALITGWPPTADQD